MLKAAYIGFKDGWEQGPELATGMSYDNDETQRVYDAFTYIGCGVAALVSKGWLKP